MGTQIKNPYVCIDVSVPGKTGGLEECRKPHCDLDFQDPETRKQNEVGKIGAGKIRTETGTNVACANGK